MNQTVIPLSSANDNSIDNTKRAIAGVTEFISFVVPVFNEQESLPLFHAELLSFLDQNQFAKFEVVYVNDGSLDGSRQTLQSIAVNDKRVCVVNLSRNFGKEVALTAGLDHATGEAAVLIDADLQHPLHVGPRLHPTLAKRLGCRLCGPKKTANKTYCEKLPRACSILLFPI